MTNARGKWWANDQDSISESHLMRECPVVFLPGGKISLLGSQKVSNVEVEVEANEVGRQALMRMLR
ncbi:MAG TPA: hypothetical protein VLX90_07365 [Steroidobacteraceae bacterium]|nr:hypothetical protein [Steroidobacteraceae bacterium]